MSFCMSLVRKGFKVKLSIVNSSIEAYLSYIFTCNSDKELFVSREKLWQKIFFAPQAFFHSNS